MDTKSPALVSEAVSPIPVTLGVSLKLYLGVKESAAWAEAVANIAREHPAVLAGKVRLVVLPAAPAICRVVAAVADAPISVGAQDIFWADRGAYTGGVSGADLVELGCQYAEIGHAERRQHFGEGAEIARRKFAAAVRNGLTPILCVGEETQVDAQAAADICIAQFESAISDAPGPSELVLAYEPEWAIGKPQPASAEYVCAVVDLVRAHLDSRGYSTSAVIYGGSAKPGLLEQLGDSVDGLFLGRFAHDPAALKTIIDEVTRIR